MVRRSWPALVALVVACQICLAATWPDLSEPPRAGQAKGAGDAAVIVGIEDYERIPDIPGARQNATDWKAWLSETRGVPADNVHLLLDRESTDFNIREEAKAAAQQVEPGGTLWFVCIGHGAPRHDSGEGTLVGADAFASVTGIENRSVTIKALAELLAAGAQEHTVMDLDACFTGQTSSGGALVQGLQPLVPVREAAPQGVTMLTATRRDQFAGPLPGLDRPAFSYLLLGALRGWGDADNDRSVTASEAIVYTEDALLALVSNRQQQPELLGPRRRSGAGVGERARA